LYSELVDQKEPLKFDGASETANLQRFVLNTKLVQKCCEDEEVVEDASSSHQDARGDDEEFDQNLMKAER
jgi:hypothetical protein